MNYIYVGYSRKKGPKAPLDMETPSERKARLKALRESQVSGEPAEDGQAPAALQEAERTHVATAQAPDEPVLRFRNYNVKDAERVVHEQVQAAHPPKAEAPTAEQPTEENEDPEVSRPHNHTGCWKGVLPEACCCSR